MSTIVSNTEKKLLVCSVPKSGTYLLAAVLRGLGWEDSGLHIGRLGYHDYSKMSIEEARSILPSNRRKASVRQSIAKICDGQFAVGHLPYDEGLSTAGVRIVFLHRNLRKALVSYSHWVSNTNRWISTESDCSWRKLKDPKLKLLGFVEQHGDRIAEHWLSLLPWQDEPTVRNLSFEGLVGWPNDLASDSAERVLRDLTLSRHEIDFESVLHSGLASDTLTKSTDTPVIEGDWGDALEHWFEESGLAEMNRQLGYEGSARLIQLTDQEQATSELKASYDKTALNEVSCPICDDQILSEIHKGDRHDLGLQTVICERCALLMTSPRPAPEWFAHFYEVNYWPTYIGSRFIDADDLFVRDRCVQRAMQILAHVRNHLESEPKSVLDVGCGQGGMLVAAQDLFPHAKIHGIDPSAAGVEFCNSRLGTGAAVRQAGFHVEQLEGQQHFDLVTLVHVLEHLEEPVKTLRYIQESLADEGRLYVEVPDLASSLWGGEDFLHIAHLYMFCESSLVRAGARAGLSPVSVVRGAASHWPWAIGVLFKRAEQPNNEELSNADPSEIELLKRHFRNRIRGSRHRPSGLLSYARRKMQSYLPGVSLYRTQRTRK